jgi:hypothetical protein
MTTSLLQSTTAATSLVTMTVPKQRERRRERRGENRRRVSDAAIIRSMTFGMAVAEVVETSPSGLRVTAPYPFRVGAEVEIVRDDERMLGLVRSCVRARSTQFHVGIGNLRRACTESAEPSETWSQLDHLTDVLR